MVLTEVYAGPTITTAPLLMVLLSASSAVPQGAVVDYWCAKHGDGGVEV